MARARDMFLYRATGKFGEIAEESPFVFSRDEGIFMCGHEGLHSGEFAITLEAVGPYGDLDSVQKFEIRDARLDDPAQIPQLDGATRRLHFFLKKDLPVYPRNHYRVHLVVQQNESQADLNVDWYSLPFKIWVPHHSSSIEKEEQKASAKGRFSWPTE